MAESADESAAVVGRIAEPEDLVIGPPCPEVLTVKLGLDLVVGLVVII